MGLIKDCTKKDCKTAKLKLHSSCKYLQCTQNQTLLQVYWSFVLCENGKRKIWPQAELSLRFTMINTTIVLQYNTSHYGYVAQYIYQDSNIIAPAHTALFHQICFMGR